MRIQTAANILSDDSLIEAVKMAREALRLYTPKRVVYNYTEGSKDIKFQCGRCKNTISDGYKYCPECGQRLLFPELHYDGKGTPVAIWRDNNVYIPLESMSSIESMLSKYEGRKMFGDD